MRAEALSKARGDGLGKDWAQENPRVAVLKQSIDSVLYVKMRMRIYDVE